MNLRTLLNESVLFYGTRTPYHPGKWRLVEALVQVFKLQRYYQGETFTVKRQGLLWALKPDCLIQRSLYYLSVFELKETVWLKAQVKPEWVFFDIGANFGYYSMVVCGASQQRAHVYAFEALESNCELIRQNQSLNNFQQLSIFQVALSDREEEIDFYSPPPSCSGVGHIALDASPGHTVKVPATTLDHFVAEHDIQRLDCLKIDVEGAETRVLQGARETLRRFKPLIMIEFFPEGLESLNTSAGELLNLIHDLGYETFRFSNKGLKPFHDLSIDDHCNVICRPI